MRVALALLALVAGATLGPGVTSAHPLAPSLLDLRVDASGRAEAVFKTPSLRPSGTSIEPVLPESCASVGEPSVSEEGSGTVFRMQLECAGESLVGQRIGFTGLDDSRTNALVRVELPDGHVVRRVLDGSEPLLSIPAAPSIWQTVREYLVLGAEHIAGGIDHLLFVAGLLLLVAGLRSLVETVTAFTIGHSVTLSAAALGLVRAPSGLIEIAIAASIVWVGVEIVRQRDQREVGLWHRPRTLAAGFGLLHGFGFAGALAEIGLPAGDIPLALASFNIGIEVGQLSFVALLAVGLVVLRSLRFQPPRWGTTAAAYAIGSLAAFWMFERIAVVL
jgi:hydrogenase/urease accessory protein HupE